jgi:hypothetical protein
MARFIGVKNVQAFFTRIQFVNEDLCSVSLLLERIVYFNYSIY